MINGKRDLWLKPKFCLTVIRRDMDMHTFLFAREKMKPIRLIPKYCWTHMLIHLQNVYNKDFFSLFVRYYY